MNIAAWKDQYVDVSYRERPHGTYVTRRSRGRRPRNGETLGYSTTHLNKYIYRRIKRGSNHSARIRSGRNHRRRNGRSMIGGDGVFLLLELKKLLTKSVGPSLSGPGGLNAFARLEDHLLQIVDIVIHSSRICLLYTSPSPRDRQKSRMPSSA